MMDMKQLKAWELDSTGIKIASIHHHLNKRAIMSLAQHHFTLGKRQDVTDRPISRLCSFNDDVSAVIIFNDIVKHSIIIIVNRCLR